MASAEKFLFDRDFTLEDPDFEPIAVTPVEPDPTLEVPETAVEEAPAPAQYSQSELDAACEAARNEGIAQGQAQATATGEQLLRQAQEDLTFATRQLCGHLDELAEQQECDSLHLTSTLLRKFFPALSAQHGLAEITAIIKDCLQRVREEPRLVVRCNDALLDSLREQVNQIAETEGYEGRFVFLSDPELEHCDLRIEWADGGLERKGATQWQAIDEILAQYVTATQPEAQPQSDPQALESSFNLQEESDNE